MEKETGNLISIIIPVYNAQAYILRCVNSILKQDYLDYELILVNDGSNKACTALLEEIEILDRRIRMINQVHKGVSAARNTGVEHSHGTWVMFIDADDYIESNALSTMVTIAEQNAADIVATEYYICKSGAISAEKFLNEENLCVYTGKERINLIKSCIESRIYGNTQGVTNIGVPWAKLYRRKVIYDEKFDIQLTHMEDTIFNVNVIMKANKIVYLPTPLYYYVIHPESVTHKVQTNFEPVAQRVIENLNEFSCKYHLETELSKAINYKKFCLYYQCIKSQYIRNPSVNSVEAIKNMRRIGKEYDWNGKYNWGNRCLYTKPQLVYSILAKMNLYGLLYTALTFAEHIRKE